MGYSTIRDAYSEIRHAYSEIRDASASLPLAHLLAPTLLSLTLGGFACMLGTPFLGLLRERFVEDWSGSIEG